MKPGRLTSSTRHFTTALIARLPRETFELLFAAVAPTDLPTFSVPEPSLGAVLELDNGTVATVAWGKLTHELDVELAPDVPVARFLDGVELPESSILWTREHERILTDPRIMLGKPVIRDTRIPVELIVRKLAEGASEADLLDGYPRLTIEDIAAARRYAIAHAAVTLGSEET